MYPVADQLRSCGGETDSGDRHRTDRELMADQASKGEAVRQCLGVAQLMNRVPVVLVSPQPAPHVSAVAAVPFTVRHGVFNFNRLATHGQPYIVFWGSTTGFKLPDLLDFGFNF
jgi:hypothetical protein